MKTEEAIQFSYAVVRMDEYIQRFRDAERVSGYCLNCPNYGNRWGCPPFDYSVEEQLHRYREVLLVAARIFPEEKNLPLEKATRYLWPARMQLEKMVLGLEQTLHGRAMGLAGQCSYCGAQPGNSHSHIPCSKAQGLPCRHPEWVRPSLEAWGFDITKTAEELLQIPILWSANGLTPAYFTWVCGFFHNAHPQAAVDALLHEASPGTTWNAPGC